MLFNTLEVILAVLYKCCDCMYRSNKMTFAHLQTVYGHIFLSFILSCLTSAWKPARR